MKSSSWSYRSMGPRFPRVIFTKQKDNEWPLAALPCHVLQCNGCAPLFCPSVRKGTLFRPFSGGLKMVLSDLGTKSIVPPLVGKTRLYLTLAHGGTCFRPPFGRDGKCPPVCRGQIKSSLSAPGGKYYSLQLPFQAARLTEKRSR